jgi:pyruvate dehydrogenase E1 component
MREMLVEQKDVFYYVTMMNENYAQPDLPEGAAADVIRGCYHFKSYQRIPHALQSAKELTDVTLLGSGAILTEVIKAAQALAAQGINVTVYSVTSWSELARDGRANLQRQLAGDHVATMPFIEQQLQGSNGPIIAATDYVCAVPESVRAYLPIGRTYVTLGTDGFGRSDTRAALRSYFGVDAASIVIAALG